MVKQFKVYPKIGQIISLFKGVTKIWLKSLLQKDHYKNKHPKNKHLKNKYLKKKAPQK